MVQIVEKSLLRFPKADVRDRLQSTHCCRSLLPKADGQYSIFGWFASSNKLVTGPSPMYLKVTLYQSLNLISRVGYF
jgi:hypothetical protein